MGVDFLKMYSQDPSYIKVTSILPARIISSGLVIVFP
ncbi:ORF381 [Staphylococcus phage Twort]|uniref:ORF381 n=1 Tax=Staphylococcus phage Twort (strain DSM 17442 / HER 48) TaxID=2908167 RepID=Q4Z9D0_BPTWO|nr:ORF381 [Staphylococcus phage Twort]AAX92487.1 ORF381 [Staphylococcus phage Twort]